MFLGIYKKVVIFTFALFSASTLFLFTHDFSSNLSYENWIKRQILIGNRDAKVQLLLFEDPLCEDCQGFFHHIFPLIEEKYVKSGLIQIAIIPLEIVGDSSTLLQTVFCLNEKDSALAFQQLINPSTVEIETLQNCPSKKAVSEFLNHNLFFAEKMMKTEIEVPKIFINGKEQDGVGYFTLSKAIDELL